MFVQVHSSEFCYLQYRDVESDRYKRKTAYSEGSGLVAAEWKDQTKLEITTLERKLKEAPLRKKPLELKR